MQETQILSDGLQSRSFNIPRYRLTKLGEQMARLPIDPKIARMLLAAKKHDCRAEILVIASALSIQDPRERPLEARDAAAKAHERFTDKQSDFLAYLNIWDSFQRERDKGLSNKQLVQWCRQYFRHAVVLLRHQQNTRDFRVDGQARHLFAEFGQAVAGKGDDIA